MRSISLIFLILFAFLQLISEASASVVGASEVSCSIYGSDALSCDQCFDGGTDYVGDTIAKSFDDYFTNLSMTDDFILARSGGLFAGPVPLQSSVTVGMSSDYGVNFPASLFFFPFGAGEVAVLFANTTTHIADMNGGILFTAVSAGADRDRPALRYEYITRTQKYDFATSTTVGGIINHKECAFVKPRWCGDGLRTNGEVCDDGVQNGQPGYCNASCSGNVPVPPPSCDNLIASTVSGEAPLAVNMTCNATNATSYRIECGNGVSSLASTTTCNYTTAGTYTPRCTVNGTVTSPACTRSVTVSAPPPTPSCSSTIAGVVTFPLSAITPGLCSVGSPSAFTTNVVGSTTFYTWNCTLGAMTSPSCSANYTPVLPTSPDLALKKFINGFDAQNVPTAVAVNNNSTFTYTVDIRNVSSNNLSASLTTVTDPLPAGVTLTGTPTGAGWNCIGAVGATSFTCTRNTALAAGASFPTITVPVRVNSSTTYLTNTAELTNPNDVITSNNTDPAVIQIIPIPGAVCGTVSGEVGAPINATTPGLCPVGATVTGFSAVGTSPVVYNWTCNSVAGTSPVCNARYTPPVPLAPYVSILKFANTASGQTTADALTVIPGGSFNYVYRISNTGTIAATGVVVTDTFPQYVTLGTVTPPAGWSCLTGTKVLTGVTYPTIICTTPTLAAGAVINITIPSTLSPTTPSGAQLRNIVYICREGDPATPNCTPGCTDPNNPTCTPPPPPPNCSPIPGSPNYDPACVVTPVVPICASLTTPTTSPVGLSVPVTYTCAASGYSGATTDLEYRIECGSPDTTATWSTGATRVCTSPNTSSTTIPVTCSVRSSLAPTVIFSGSTVGACRQTLTTTPGGGGELFYIPLCVNDIPTCANQFHNNEASCIAYNKGASCYRTTVSCEANLPTCTGGGGTTSDGGRCGDGVLQLPSEECDVPGATFCGQPGETNAAGVSIACKLKINTNPGANPLTDLWMNIPTLSNTRIGQTWMDGVPGQLRYEENNLILGQNTRAFTLGDIIRLGLKTGVDLPIILEASKAVCLDSTGTALNDATLCSTFGRYVPGVDTFAVGGKTYIRIGRGYYQIWNGTGYDQFLSTSPNNIVLFRGPDTYNLNPTGSSTLARAFTAQNPGTNGQLSIIHYSSSTGEPIDLVSLDVKVAGTMVGGASSVVNRKIETYINSKPLVTSFLEGFRPYTTPSSTTSAVNTGRPTSSVNISGGKTGNFTANTLAKLEELAVNGNKNILKLSNGNLTLDCTTIDLTGVRSVIVENGDLILKCNTGYPASDTNSSWAWIVASGSIIVDNGDGSPTNAGITNMAGVFVAIGSGSTGGKFLPRDGRTTTAILKLNGSMYGNAEPLFDSRLYVRGTTAYDILTTGVVLSYSNRALLNPPPLLSQYLNNYSVTRVVK